MTAGELAVLLAAVLCCIGFAALVVVLGRVLDTLRSLGVEVEALRCETRPLLAELQASTHEAREVMELARTDLDRFDRVLGLCRSHQWGDDRRWSRRARCTVRPGDQDSRAGHGHLPGLAAPETQGEQESTMKRLTWFLGGAVAGIIGAGAAKKKVKAAAAELAPVNMARKARGRVSDAWNEGRRAMRSKEAELKARLDGRAGSLADDLADGDEVLVDGLPVEPGQVIVLRQVRDRADDADRADGRDSAGRRRRQA